MRRHLVRMLLVGFVVSLASIAQMRQATAIADGDSDGIDDVLEQQLATQFFPQWHFTDGEDCDGPVPKPVLFRARYLSHQGIQYTNYIGINYVVLYDNDCGFDPHYGDNEPFLVILHNDGSGWQFQSLSARAHWGKPGDTKTASYTNRLWVAENKHANYANLWACGQGLPYDDCSENGPSRTRNLHNVGEPSAHLLNDLPYGDTVWGDEQYQSAGNIEQQLYTSGFYLLSNAPGIDACTLECENQYNYCMAMTGYNYEQCSAEQYGCNYLCAQYSYRWDP